MIGRREGINSKLAVRSEVVLGLVGRLLSLFLYLSSLFEILLDIRSLDTDWENVAGVTGESIDIDSKLFPLAGLGTPAVGTTPFNLASKLEIRLLN